MAARRVTVLLISLWLAPTASHADPVPFDCSDTGVFSDLDHRVALDLPPGMTADDTSLLVDKRHRTLSLLAGGVPVGTWPVALGFEPEGSKERRGDGRTPEGILKIVEVRAGPDLPPRYGAASLLLNYPRLVDGEKGRRKGFIGRRNLVRIRQAETAGRIPPQNTPLGSSIRIHGGGAGPDWTLGCIGMKDAHILSILPFVRTGTPVTVLPDLPKSTDQDGDGIPDTVDVLVGARKAVLNGAKYAGGYEKLRFPGGDVSREKGVCTDVVVRALRNAGWDLQQMTHRDMKKYPKRFPNRRPDPNIQHRRVRNLIKVFKRRFKDLGTDPFVAGEGHWRPGDVVFMDTFSNRAGPDHIGILSERTDADGYPLVINNWTHGYSTREMSLLPSIPITHRFRLPVP